MNRYLKLVHFEFQRFHKIYLVLIGILVVSQIVGVIVQSTLYINKSNEMIYEEKMQLGQFLSDFGMMSFSNIANSYWLIVPMALIVATLLIYMIFIWYRDWLGKNTFIYRLLMLPTERMNVFTAKATTIMLLVLGMVAIQIIMLQVDAQILKWLVPDEFLLDMTTREMMAAFDYMGIVYPFSFGQFIIHYGLGLLVMVVAYTIILFERSFRLKGILFGILYGFAAVFVFFLPLILQYMVLDGYFYPEELVTALIVTALLVLAGSIWISRFLLNKKIRV